MRTSFATPCQETRCGSNNKDEERKQTTRVTIFVLVLFIEGNLFNDARVQVPARKTKERQSKEQKAATQHLCRRPEEFQNCTV